MNDYEKIAREYYQKAITTTVSAVFITLLFALQFITQWTLLDLVLICLAGVFGTGAGICGIHIWIINTVFLSKFGAYEKKKDSILATFQKPIANEHIKQLWGQTEPRLTKVNESQEKFTRCTWIGASISFILTITCIFIELCTKVQ